MPAIKDATVVAAKYNGELVGGRVIVTINGQRQYITDSGPDGNWFNLLGQQLEQGDIAVDNPPVVEEAMPIDPAPATPARTRKAKAANADTVAADTPAGDGPSLDDEVANALAGN